jgi:hypothetical protein
VDGGGVGIEGRVEACVDSGKSEKKSLCECGVCYLCM